MSVSLNMIGEDEIETVIMMKMGGMKVVAAVAAVIVMMIDRACVMAYMYTFGRVSLPIDDFGNSPSTLSM